MKTQDFWFGYCPACFKPTERRVDFQTGRCDIAYQPDCPTREACEKRILGPMLKAAPLSSGQAVAHRH